MIRMLYYKHHKYNSQIIKQKTMKRIIILLAGVLMLTSCATVSRGVRWANGPAARNGDQVARSRVAATDIKSFRDRNTNAVVYQSMYEDYCFSVAFGTVKLVNTKGPYIEVYEYDPSRSEDWLLKETVHRNGPFRDILAWTKKQPQLISFASGDNGALFVKVHSAVYQNGEWKKTALLRSYTF